MPSRRLRERATQALADRYRIEEELGHGGTSTVFRAVDLRHDRPVAVKVLHPEVTAVLGRERFLREIDIAAGLAHPHILPLYDSGERDGLLFHVTPLHPGESLRDRLLRDRILPLDEALRIGTELLDALSHAHRHGVVHRDVKPENVVLSGQHALLADFGVALALARSGGSRLTGTGIVVGTPAYMSPEQASGQEIDARSDIYAAACVICEMLVGEAPFAARTPQAVIARRLTEEPCSLRTVRPDVPEAVDRALRKGMARLPAERFQSAEEFAAALAHRESAVAEGSGTAGTERPARTAGGVGRAGFWAEMRRRKVWSAAAIYGSVWFVLLELATNSNDLLRLPDTTAELLARLVFGVGLAGFPVTLAFAWMFEITSERTVRRTGAWRVEGQARPSRLPLLTRGAVVALSLALALLTVWKLVVSPLLSGSG